MNIELTIPSLCNYLDTQYGLESPILGVSPFIAETRTRLQDIQEGNSNVLVQGERGTGKFLAALSIHNNSRKDQPFVVVDCRAIPGKEIEDRLMGEKGLIKQAGEGTVVLQHVIALSPSVQKAFFTYVYNGNIKARMICCSHEDMQEHVKKDAFRADIYEKICHYSLILPSLRSRPEDIPQLANYFIQLYNRKYGKAIQGLQAGVVKHLQGYDWPGNIDQLRNTMERLVLIETGPEIREERLPVEIYSASRNGANGEAVSLKDVRYTGEKQVLIDLLREHKGNQSKVARILGVHRNTVLNKINTFKINPKDYKGR